ncbi:IS701 family transposase [Burkholderia multivorans]|nr:IS701 family transposase [Burkholderia multivorans]MBU9559039.1 IS701 family transposase [Burkholderia multivorans]
MELSTKRFEDYVSLMAQALGHADRVEPFRGYCTGLMLPVKRKSVEPMAAHLSPERVRSEHQRLHHFVADAPWSDRAVLDTVRRYVLERIRRRAGSPEALIIDDTGFPKKGKHSVGVARQYCGQLGKQDNCQVAVSVSLANDHFSLPICYQLYLPQSWANDAERRKAAKVPEALEFVTKPMLALQLLENLGELESRPELVLADAGYGASTEFREQLTAMGFTYVVGVTGAVSVQFEGQPPLQAKELAMQLPSRRYRTVTWREGTNRALSSRFAAIRVHCASRAAQPAETAGEQWLLIEWPKGEAEPTRYFLSTLPADTPIKELIRLAKLRWRIERDYQELKQELGLGHFEGRSWRGFHHHATLCIAAYGFLVTERLVAQKKNPAHRLLGEVSSLPEGFRPRGAPT